MIGTIRHHQKWLWAVIIVATIVSFVYFFSPNQKALSESGKQDFGSVNGRSITRAEMRDAGAEARLLYFLRAGSWPGNDAAQNGFDLERETYNRLALIEKLAELKLEPNADATAQWIEEAFGSTNGVFPMERFEGFIKTELTPHNLTQEDFSRFARHQVGLQELISVYGLGGKLITAPEVEFFYRQLNEPFVTEAVLFSASNYVSAVPSSPALIGEYFTNNVSDYRLPERMQVNYVQWDFTNFSAQADHEIAGNTNLDQQIEMAYVKNGVNSFKDASGKILSAADAKNKMKSEYRKNLAMNFAAKKANEFLTALAEGHDDTHPYQIEDMEKLAKTRGLEIKTTPPFDQRDMVKLKLSPQFVQTAFRLRNDDSDDKSNESLYSLRPIPGENAVYAIGFKKRFPSELQSLETVRKQVE
ncbi:MAG: SurA N-terminal domain-containing protein, partial [Verrucomicrobiota bacterium]